MVGEAPIDCDNANPNDIVFSYSSGGSAASSPVRVANTVSQELAHSFFLVHVNDGTDMMHPAEATNDRIFSDRCIPVDGSVYCGAQHARECGTQTQQNAHRELLAVLGAATVEDLPPQISIVSPPDGSTFAAPANLELRADAQDDRVVIDVRLRIDGVDQGAPRSKAPYTWQLLNLPAGPYTLETIARDAAGNEGAATIHIEVSAEPDPDSDSGADADSATGSDSGLPPTGSGEGESDEGESGQGESDEGEAGEDESSTGSDTAPTGDSDTNGWPPPSGPDPDSRAGCAVPGRGRGQGGRGLVILLAVGLVPPRRKKRPEERPPTVRSSSRIH